MTVVRSISGALLVLVLACGVETPKPESVAIPVFLISIDTLRSDRLPSYGYEKGMTPAIDALRRDSILFERAFTPCPLTLPAHASLFTGVLPPSHGIRDNAGYLLSPDAVTLASHFEQRGYETGAAVSSYILRRGSGIERGFDFYDDAMEAGSGADLSSVERDGSRTADRLKQWLSGQAS